MNFGVGFQFDSRYTGLEGKFVSVNFRYYSVDTGGRQTSGYGYTGYGAPARLASMKRASNGVVYNDQTYFYNTYVEWAGRLRTDVNIAVHDGIQWHYTGWLTIPQYNTQYWDSLSWQWMTQSDCLTSSV